MAEADKEPNDVTDTLGKFAKFGWIKAHPVYVVVAAIVVLFALRVMFG